MGTPVQEIITRVRETLAEHHTDENGFTDLEALYADMAAICSDMAATADLAASVHVPYARLVEASTRADNHVSETSTAAASARLVEAAEALRVVARGFRQLDAEYGQAGRDLFVALPPGSSHKQHALKRAQERRAAAVGEGNLL